MCDIDHEFRLAPPAKYLEILRPGVGADHLLRRAPAEGADDFVISYR